MKTPCAVLLASASPRRRELLGQLGVTFKVVPADIEETMLSGETPESFVRRMACEKAMAVFHRSVGDTPVLGSDTIVLLKNKILGKPDSRKAARSMLKSLSGETHHVYSAVALVMDEHRIADTLNVTAVTFAAIPMDWINRYCLTSEPMDKAGAYAVQGEAGQYIRHIEGSYSGVMGLPLYETAKLLRSAGLLI